MPAEVLRWQDLENTARQFFHIHNYKEIRTPYFEETELFARSMGQTSEVVQKQMLTLNSQKEEESASHYSLRPEGTAAVLRSYIENHMHRHENLSKLFYVGPMFRGERPQKGRLRQFHQMGVEAIGPQSSSPYLDAEVIAMSVHLLKAFGLNHFTLRINTLGDDSDRTNFARFLRDQLGDRMNTFEPALQKSFKDNIFRVLDSKDPQAKKAVKGLGLNHSYLSKESADYFAKLKATLKEMNVEFEEDFGLVRGLDYYTHTVFEISDPSLGSQDALGAGGRYNNLAGQLGGGGDIEAIGFALGLERILLSLGENKSVASSPLSYYIIALEENFFGKAFMLLNALRHEGIAADIGYKSASVKSQMRTANKANPNFVVLIGEEEIVKNQVTVKNMKTGEQTSIALEEFERFALENR